MLLRFQRGMNLLWSYPASDSFAPMPSSASQNEITYNFDASYKVFISVVWMSIKLWDFFPHENFNDFANRYSVQYI